MNQTLEQSIPSLPKRNTLSVFIAIVSLLIALTAVGISVVLWKQIKLVNGQFADKDHALQNVTFSLQKTVTQQQYQIADLQKKLTVFKQAKQQNTQHLVIEEVNYLVQLANFNLMFQHNMPLTVKLLNLADQQIYSLNNSALLPARQAITNTVSSLNALPELDVAGIIMRINALSTQITKLSLTPSLPQAQSADLANSATANKAGWQRFLDSLLASLHDIVIIRHHEQPIAPLIAPNAQTYLIENIRSQLAQAQWAVLHQEPVIYQQSLQQASTWIQQYFTKNAAVSKNLIAAIVNLQKIDIKPDLPDLSPLIKTLQSILSKPGSSILLVPAMPAQEVMPT